MPRGNPSRAPRPGLDDTRYQAARKQLKTYDRTCHRCGYPIDMQLRSPHPLSWTADHIIPRVLLTDPTDYRHWHISNLQAMHRRCNGSKGAKTTQVKTKGQPLNTSQQW